VDDVWGIGPRYGRKLTNEGVCSAFDFINLSKDYVLKLVTIQGRRIYRELRGERCIPMEYGRPGKEGISTSRSFNCMITELSQLEEAAACYVVNAAFKLRSQKSVTAKLMVFVQTSRFMESSDRYAKETVIRLTSTTNDIATLIKKAAIGLRRIYIKGYRYQKVGVELRDLRPETQVQAALFDPLAKEKRKKMQQVLKAIDTLNKNYHRPDLEKSPTGEEIKIEKKGARKTYYTDEQVLYN
jgi:DNA polymerase V